MLELVRLVQFLEEALVDGGLEGLSKLDLAGLNPVYLYTPLGGGTAA